MSLSKQNNSDNNDALPPCPDCMMCPISCERMVEPVMASDGHTYEREQIQQWFNLHNTTSPKTGETLTSLVLTANLGLKTLILEWVTDQTQGTADKKKLDELQAPLFRIKTSSEALTIIQEISEHIETSKFCLMAASDVERLKTVLLGFKLLNDELVGLLAVLADQCQSKIQSMQEDHRSVSTKCVGLELAKASVRKEEDAIKNVVSKLEKKMNAANKKVPAAQKRVDSAETNLANVKKVAEDTTK